MSPKRWQQIQIRRCNVVLFALDIRELVEMEKAFLTIHSVAGKIFLECIQKEIKARSIVESLQVQPWDKAKREGEKV